MYGKTAIHLAGYPKVKTTTLRMGEDLWALLEGEAERAEVSVSQYVREAALARAAFAAGNRAGVPSELLTQWAASALGSGTALGSESQSTQRLIAALGRSIASEEREAARALRDESRQAQRRTRELARRAKS